MRLIAATTLCVVCLASPLRAQEADSARTSLVPGTYSLSFGIPGYGSVGGSGTYGFWRMMSPRTNLGLFVQINGTQSETTVEFSDTTSDRETDDKNFTITAGPAIRRYVTTTERVAPYVYGSVQAGYTTSRRRADPNYQERSSGMRGVAEAGVGLEWFPVRAISFSGHTGLQASVTSQDGRSNTGGFENVFTNIGTFTTSLSANIYFAR